MTALHPKICRAIATARTGGLMSRSRDLAREAQREVEAAALESAATSFDQDAQFITDSSIMEGMYRAARRLRFRAAKLRKGEL